MKANRFVFAIIFVVLGAVIALAPYTFAEVCSTAEKIMKCHWTARVELFLGITVAALGIVKFFFADKNFQLGINFGILFNALGVILIPTVIIGVCGMKTMHCNAVSKPVLVVLGIVTAVAAVVQSVSLWKKQ